MDRTIAISSSTNSSKSGGVERQLAQLKILSRLLGHELHAQTGPRITLSREEVDEIQSTVDLFIEQALRSSGGPTTPVGEMDIKPISASIN